MRKIICLLGLLIALTPPAFAGPDQFQENLNYFEIFPNYPGSEMGKVEVLEFFWYNCPHCHDFEPQLEQWLSGKPTGTEFSRVPVVFIGRDGRPNPTGKLHAETFYSLELMGKLEGLHGIIFNAIHGQGIPLDTPDALEQFLAGKGVDAGQFRNTRQSFAVQSRVNRSIELAKRFGIDGVPSLVVGGTYRTGTTGSFEKMTQLADFLIAKVKEAQKPTATVQ